MNQDDRLMEAQKTSGEAHPAIRVFGLEVRARRRHPRLRVDELTVEHGSALGLFGSGTDGETALLDCLSGTIAPDAGEILVGGVALRARRSEGLPIGYMPKDETYLEGLSVSENIAVSMMALCKHRPVRAVRSSRIERLAELLDLREFLRADPTNLPIGVRRRTSLACAIVHEPQILIADDPLNGVDAQTAALMERTMRLHVQSGNTLLFSCSREEEIERLADTICILQNGEIVVQGTLDDLQRAHSKQEQISVRVQSGAAALAKRVREMAGVRSVAVDGQTIVADAERDGVRLTRLAEHIQALGLELLEIRIRKPGVREIYETLERQPK